MEDRENEYYVGCEYEDNEDIAWLEDDVIVQEILKENNESKNIKRTEEVNG